MDIRHLAVTASIVSALLASGCQAADQKVSASPPAQGAPPVSSGAKTNRPTYTAAPPVGDLTQYAKQQVVIETERGNIVFELYPKEAPKTVASFVKLAQDGFYAGGRSGGERLGRSWLHASRGVQRPQASQGHRGHGAHLRPKQRRLAVLHLSRGRAPA